MAFPSVQNLDQSRTVFQWDNLEACFDQAFTAWQRPNASALDASSEVEAEL